MATISVPSKADGRRHFIYIDSTFHLLAIQQKGISQGMLRVRDVREKRALEAAEHIFAIAEYVKHDIVTHYGIPASKVTVVGTGRGSIQPFIGEKPDQKLVLFVAKVRFADKGGDLLLEGFRLAHKQDPELRLVMVVEPQYQGMVEAVPGAMFKTSLSWAELENLFHQAGLFAMPAPYEPWGLVYLEALACQCPVLGLDRNALPEIAGYGDFGFLLKTATPEAIAAGLREAFADQARLRQMGLKGQQSVLERFTWRETAARMLSVVQQCPQG